MTLTAVTEILKSYLAVLVFSHSYAKRSGFYFRLVGCFLLHIFLVQRLVAMAQGVSAGLVISYTIDYAVMFFAMRGCYDISWSQAIFTTTAGRATKFFIANFIFLISVGNEGFAVPSELLPAVLQILLIFVPFCVFAYYIIGRRINTEEYDSPENFPLKMISAVTIFACVFINRFVKDFGPREPQVIVAESLYAMICSSLCLYLQFEICRRSQIQSRERAVHALWQEDQKRLDDSKKIMEQINIKCHDIRHKLAESHLRITEDEKQELKDLIQIYDRRLETGCPTLNVILAEQSLLCEQMNIAFTFNGDASCLNKLSEAEIYSLFGNALNNAVEASAQVEEEKRQISMIIQCRGALVSASVVNYQSGTLQFSNGLPLTTAEENRTDHGYGMRSMQLIAQRHGGDIKVESEDGIFTLLIWFMAA